MPLDQNQNPPKPPIGVAMYTPFTGVLKPGFCLSDQLNDGDMADKRLMNLEEKITQATAQLNQHHQKPLHIFIAPEWYFRRKDVPYSEDEMRHIVNTLLNVARRFPDLLIIPGSIHWGRPVEGHTWTVYNAAPVIKNGQLLGLVHKAYDADDTRVQPVNHRAPIKLVWGLYKEDRRELDPNKMNAISQWVRQTFDSETNTTGVFDLKDLGLSFALDIGADHSRKRIRKQFIEQRQYPEVDIHLQISAGPDLDKRALCLGKDGYGVGCNGGQFKERLNRLDSQIVRCQAVGWNKDAEWDVETIINAELATGSITKPVFYNQVDNPTHRIVIFKESLTFPPSEEVGQSVAHVTSLSRIRNAPPG